LGRLGKDFLEVLGNGDIRLDEKPVGWEFRIDTLTVNANHAEAAFMEVLHGCPPHTSGGAGDQHGFLHIAHGKSSSVSIVLVFPAL